MSSDIPPSRLVAPGCPLCGASDAYPVEGIDAQTYYECPQCSLIYLHPAHYLSAAAERARYELHENDPTDPGYVAFLRRLADPIMERLRPGARGLDFGCGPAPVLSGLFTSAGFSCAAYDPFFAPDETLLDGSHDFITCSEVAEHAHDPASVFTTLRRMLAPGGLLGVMTRFHQGQPAFGDWWYRRDPTHVCFYAESTMGWIAVRHGLRLELPVPDVALFLAPPA